MIVSILTHCRRIDKKNCELCTSCKRNMLDIVENRVTLVVIGDEEVWRDLKISGLK